MADRLPVLVKFPRRQQLDSLDRQFARLAKAARRNHSYAKAQSEQSEHNGLLI
jgi:hypothetical protein